MEEKLDNINSSQGITRDEVMLKENINKLKEWIQGIDEYF